MVIDKVRSEKGAESTISVEKSVSDQTRSCGEWCQMDGSLQGVASGVVLSF